MLNKTFSIIALIVLILMNSFWSFVLAQQLPPYPKMSNQAADDMAATWAFYKAQALLIQSYSEKFPMLSEELKVAQLFFDDKFADSIANIDAIMTTENRPWLSTKQELIQTLNKTVSLAKQEATYSQAKSLIEEVKKKAKGELPSPYLETLLIYKTDFLKRPPNEFLEGYKNTFSSENHPKANGVNFELSFPKSWKAKEGRLKSVINIIMSENGRGLEGLILSVKTLPVSEGKEMSVTEIKEFLSLNTIRKSLPSNVQIISETQMKIDNLPSKAVLFEVEQMQLSMNLKSRCLLFTTLYQNKLIFLQFFVTSAPGEEKNLISRFNKFDPLFRLMANSMIVKSQYQ